LVLFRPLNRPVRRSGNVLLKIAPAQLFRHPERKIPGQGLSGLSGNGRKRLAFSQVNGVML
jgi:hypothetical protein